MRLSRRIAVPLLALALAGPAQRAAAASLSSAPVEAALFRDGEVRRS
ncbi:MAG: hypothetical protein INR64_13020, partial [Caulobacteraceae bacterium]|nr:hypothetical protein [Caulobacter sp.]